MTTLSITQGQAKQAKRLAEDAVDQAIAEGTIDKNGFQRLVVEKGGDFQKGIVQLIRELSAPEPVRGWTEKDGVIRFTVTSDGTTGPEWITRLEEKGFKVEHYAKSVLRRKQYPKNPSEPYFNPTKGVTTQIEVLKGELFSDSDRVTHKIRAEAERRKLATPNAEVACLIREKFTDEEIEAMGLWCIVAMHDRSRIPMAIRASWAWTAMAIADGSTRAMIGPISSGVVMTGSHSLPASNLSSWCLEPWVSFDPWNPCTLERFVNTPSLCNDRRRGYFFLKIFVIERDWW